MENKFSLDKKKMIKQNVSQFNSPLASAGQCSHLFLQDVDQESSQVDGS
jgi:hypothetical protein